MTIDRPPTLIRVDETDRHGLTPRAIQRHAASGALVRLRAGVYVRSAVWRRTTHDARYLARIAAVSFTRRSRPILFGPSAAAVLGLPLVGAGSLDVHLLAGTRSAPPNGAGVVWHRDAVPMESLIEVGGFVVTDVQRTLFDLARHLPFLRVVAALDRGVRSQVETAGVELLDRQLRPGPRSLLDGTSTEHLLEELRRRPRQRGVSRAARSVSFADPRADSVGESISRARIHLLGFPAPRLQVPLAREDGGRDIVDFDWPEFRLAGEFDGRVKYFREEYRAGRTIDEVVWAERERERRIKRHHARDVARWVWSDALRGAGLCRELLAAGLPIVRSRPTDERE